MVDSLTRSAVQVETARLFSTVDQLETTLIVFDTSAPSEGTILPPVKAVIRQTARHEEVARDTAGGSAVTETSITSRLTDRSAGETVVTAPAREKRSWWSTTKRVLIAAGVALALGLTVYGICKLIKFFKK